MLTITFARHGHYDFGPLSEEGIKEVRSLAKVLDGQNFQQLSILSSPQDRATQTSEILAEMLGIKNVSQLESLQVDSTKGLSDVSKKDAALFAPKYMAQFIGLPKPSNDILVVSHQPNINGFGVAFANAARDLYCNPQTGGAVTYSFNTDETWENAIRLMKMQLMDIRIALVHRANICRLG